MAYSPKPKKKNGGKKARSAASAAAEAAVQLAGPPALVQSPRTSDVLRFQALAAVSSSVDITWACLRALYFQTTTATTGNTIFQAIKLKGVEVWAPATGASTGISVASTLALRWREGNGMVGDDKVISDTITSSAGAHVGKRFSPVKTDMGKWHLCSEITTSDVAFTIVGCPSGTVIDIHLSWSGWAAGSAVTALTVGGLTAGRMVRNFLDNTASGGGTGPLNLAPIGVIGNTGAAFQP